MSPMSPRLLRPRATGFTPRSIANLTGWYDAADASSYTATSGQISQWQDKSGAGNHITQGTANNRPTLFTSSGDTQSSTASTINGRQSLFFDGANDFLSTTATVTSGQSRTVLAIATRSDNSTFGTLAAFGTVEIGANSTARWLCRYGATGQSVVGGDSVNSNQSISAVQSAWLSPHISVWSQDSNTRNLTYIVNGESLTVSGNPTAAQSSFAGLAVGRMTRSDFPQYFGGHVGEILIYDRELTTAQRQNLEGYLAWRWGLQATLPYDHPYAASFPGYGTQATPSDADALAYLSAVRTADGGTGVEVGVANAVDSFVKGCKSDGTWSAIKASCILAGARTLSGALVPLAGTAPTNVNFVAADYNRKTGLVGNGSTKYLNSNRAANADGQNDFYMSLYASSAATNAGGTSSAYAGGGGNSVGGLYSYSAISRFNAVGAFDGISAYCRTGNFASVAGKNTVGFIGMSRSASASFVGRGAGSNTTVSQTSVTPNNNSIALFAQNELGVVNSHSNVRLAFYAIGSSLDLAMLDTRVSALYTAIGAAI